VKVLRGLIFTSVNTPSVVDTCPCACGGNVSGRLCGALFCVVRGVGHPGKSFSVPLMCLRIKC
jgi:hypothetical protein